MTYQFESLVAALKVGLLGVTVRRETEATAMEWPLLRSAMDIILGTLYTVHEALCGPVHNQFSGPAAYVTMSLPLAAMLSTSLKVVAKSKQSRILSGSSLSAFMKSSKGG